MSAIKKIIIIFNRDVELAELTKDLTKLSESEFFGLTGKHWEYYFEPFNQNVSIPLGFIKLNGNEYDLFAKYYSKESVSAIRMVAFENDWADFYEDFVGSSDTDDPKSKNVKKLIALLRGNLSYYSIMLLTYDFIAGCPHTEELLDLYLNGTLDNAEGRCYLILDNLC